AGRSSTSSRSAARQHGATRRGSPACAGSTPAPAPRTTGFPEIPLPPDETSMMYNPPSRAGRLALVALVLLALVPADAQAQLLPRLRSATSDRPPRSVPEAVPERPVPRWLRTNLRIGHLPPGLGRMPESYAKAGYNVIILNALRKWEIVGPSADLYDPAEVRRADKYLRDFVALAHGGGAQAGLYIGPVHVPYFSPECVKAHPDWLRINADGKPDAKPNFANIRSGYTDWMLKQLAHVVRAYKVDGFWFDGFAPGHLHTYDPATREAFRKVSGG